MKSFKNSRVHTRLHRRARTSPFCPKNEPSVFCRCYPYQRRSAVFIEAIFTARYLMRFSPRTLFLLLLWPLSSARSFIFWKSY